jgi:hypothetical protein
MQSRQWLAEIAGCCPGLLRFSRTRLMTGFKSSGSLVPARRIGVQPDQHCRVARRVSHALRAHVGAGAENSRANAKSLRTEPRGPFGLFQPVADGIKMLIKEDIVPARADKVVHFLAPVVLAAVAILTLGVIPYGRNMTPVHN